jgi:hypothetical protein
MTSGQGVLGTIRREGHGVRGVFTFALLDALARADKNNNGLIEWAELIQHIDGLVLDIIQKGNVV